jgi:hypothetical protein
MVKATLPRDERKYQPQTNGAWMTTDGKSQQQFVEMQLEYSEFWGRAPWTGEKL